MAGILRGFGGLGQHQSPDHDQPEGIPGIWRVLGWIPRDLRDLGEFGGVWGIPERPDPHPGGVSWICPPAPSPKLGRTGIDRELGDGLSGSGGEIPKLPRNLKPPRAQPGTLQNPPESPENPQIPPKIPQILKNLLKNPPKSRLFPLSLHGSRRRLAPPPRTRPFPRRALLLVSSHPPHPAIGCEMCQSNT